MDPCARELQFRASPAESQAIRRMTRGSRRKPASCRCAGSGSDVSHSRSVAVSEVRCRRDSNPRDGLNRPPAFQAGAISLSATAATRLRLFGASPTPTTDHLSHYRFQRPAASCGAIPLVTRRSDRTRGAATARESFRPGEEPGFSPTNAHCCMQTTERLRRPGLVSLAPLPPRGDPRPPPPSAKP